MSEIHAIDGLLVNKERVSAVVSPAYDALTPQERHRFAVAHPGNYLNAMRSREEYPPEECPDLDTLLSLNKKTLEAMVKRGDFVRLSNPALFIYRLVHDDHVQTGVVAEVPVSEYESGEIKKHEHTQDSKQNDLVAYQCSVGASSSPICLAYEPVEAIDAFVEELTDAAADLDFVTDDGTRQLVWCVKGGAQIGKFRELFNEVPASYLTDGHHRAAASVEFRNIRRRANSEHTGAESYNRFLVAFFPADQLRILEYNRCVRGLNGLSRDEFLTRAAERFDVEALGRCAAQLAKPRVRGEFGVYLQGEWYRLVVKRSAVPVNDPVGALDVSLLQDALFAPVLSITDPRTDPRLSYLSGAFSVAQLASHCDTHDLVGYVVHPTAIEDLMGVADAGKVMPPKSTWFDPKLRSGIFLLLK